MTVAIEPDVWPDHAVLHDISWELYEKLLREIGEQRVKLTYDEGTLEIMSPLPEHEYIKTVLARMLEMLVVELSIPMVGYGSVTLKRKSLQKASEPDECYYIAHEREMRARKRFDLRRDPPPDLVFEVDLSYRTIDKRLIYLAMRVPEIWSWDQGKLTFLHLKRNKYEERETSLSFPFLRVADVQRFLDRSSEDIDNTTFIQQWRDWVSKHLGEYKR